MGASQSVPGGCETANSGGVDPAVRRAGFAALYDAHVTEVYQYVHRRCRDRAVAEDVTQDVFLALVRTVDDPATVTIGWLMRTARNRLVDVMRRQATHSAKLRLIRGDGDRIPLDGIVVDRVTVEAALERLSVEHRVVLALHYLDGEPVPAMAEQLGRTVKSVEGLVARATRNLRREIGNVKGDDA